MMRPTSFPKLNESFAAMMGGFQAVRAKRSGLAHSGSRLLVRLLQSGPVTLLQSARPETNLTQPSAV